MGYVQGHTSSYILDYFERIFNTLKVMWDIIFIFILLRN
jgi:hypothetical protein